MAEGRRSPHVTDKRAVATSTDGPHNTHNKGKIILNIRSIPRTCVLGRCYDLISCLAKPKLILLKDI